MRKRLLVTYLVIIHAILALVLVKSDFLVRVGTRLGFKCADTHSPEITEHFRRMVRSHERIDGNVPEGAAVFIGDSHTQGLCVDAVITPSVNYGIGSDTTAGVLTRLPKYRSLERASVVVLAIGINDLEWRDDAAIVANYKSILASLPRNLPIVVNAIFPVSAKTTKETRLSNARVRELNRALQELCSSDSRCVFVDAGAKLADHSGDLQERFQDGDGVHLTTDGYRLWIAALKDAVLKAKRNCVQ